MLQRIDQSISSSPANGFSSDDFFGAGDCASVFIGVGGPGSTCALGAGGAVTSDSAEDSCTVFRSLGSFLIAFGADSELGKNRIKEIKHKPPSRIAQFFCCLLQLFG